MRNRKTLCTKCQSAFEAIYQDDAGVFVYCPHNKVLGCREMEDGEETGGWSETYPFEITTGWLERYKKLKAEARMEQITVGLDPNEKFDTQYGHITAQDWLEKEKDRWLRRGPEFQAEVRVLKGGKMALFSNGEGLL